MKYILILDERDKLEKDYVSFKNSEVFFVVLVDSIIACRMNLSKINFDCILINLYAFNYPKEVLVQKINLKYSLSSIFFHYNYSLSQIALINNKWELVNQKTSNENLVVSIMDTLSESNLF